MKHILVSREFAPAPGGGIGTYANTIARMLAEVGETVHVVSQMWRGAEKPVEELIGGRLIVHRVPFSRWDRDGETGAHPKLVEHDEARGLFESACPGLAFGWMATPVIEQIVEQEQIDLIEGPDFEAPLYFLQLRRALGLGPRHQPPYVVHLHSSTETIALSNEDPFPPPYQFIGRRHEDYSITAADALMTPSQFMADWMQKRYGLEEGRISVVRLPLSHKKPEHIQRSPEVWHNGPLLFVGRLQVQKGVIELVRTAVRVAREFPDLRIEFVGRDVTSGGHASMQRCLEDLIPPDVKSRFTFHGEKTPAEVQRFRAAARAALVTSKFESFGYVGLEAMSSGLPLAVTPTTGVADLVQDGNNGWIAAGNSERDIAEMLRRVLGTTPEQLRNMGDRAAVTVREQWQDEQILQEHLEFRNRAARAGNSRSRSFAPVVPFASTRAESAPPCRSASTSGATGVAVVITCYNLGKYLPECLESVRAQSVQPLETIIVDDGSTDAETHAALKRARRDGWHIAEQPNAGLIGARRTGYKLLREKSFSPLAVVFLDADDRLRPRFIEQAEQALRNAPQVGIVSCYTKHFGAADMVWAEPCPAFPYQWIMNSAATFSAYRVEAFDAVGGYRDLGDGCYADWDLNNAIMVQGWVAVTLPEVLAEYRVRSDSMLREARRMTHCNDLYAMLTRFPAEVSRDAPMLVAMTEAESFELRARITRMHMALRNPRLLLNYLWRRLRK